MSGIGARTYTKGLGLLNVHEKPPLIEAGGVPWVVRDGEDRVAMYPDTWESVQHMAPLPPGTEAIDFEGNYRTT